MEEMEPIMRKNYLKKYKWLDDQEFKDEAILILKFTRTIANIAKTIDSNYDLYPIYLNDKRKIINDIHDMIDDAYNKKDSKSKILKVMD